ncbi:MAG: hypothetical protein UY72_C0061G0008 [Candidatus Uhrbacteria bacterium GW2011_GWD2_52_7]|uniref:Conjugal transfer protein TrbC n=1 Tax=Candidatus Uhrbacteria bacterium GW2011_GWD2_52_7 TaxID=1618989 RepID=A0A0G1XBZ4_9BACT|nr:MAG: hypothetical protein UY72_C0061G0008 [Candidatus Uhrbacteria bacterium GW2011_GWD2_52_7]
MRRLLTSLLTTTLAFMPSVTLAASVTLTNPLGTSDARQIIGRVISAALSVVGTLALLMFIYGGFLWLVSRGDPKMVGKGKDIMTWTILGLVVIFGAYVIVHTILTGLVTGSVTTS